MAGSCQWYQSLGPYWRKEEPELSRSAWPEHFKEQHWRAGREGTLPWLAPSTPSSQIYPLKKSWARTEQGFVDQPTSYQPCSQLQEMQQLQATIDAIIKRLDKMHQTTDRVDGESSIRKSEGVVVDQEQRLGGTEAEEEPTDLGAVADHSCSETNGSAELFALTPTKEKWEEVANDLHQAFKIDFDEELNSVLKKVEPNARKIEEPRRKYGRLRKENEEKKIERERQCRRAEAQAAYEKAKRQEQSSSTRPSGGMPGGFPSGFPGGMPGGFPGGMPGGFPGAAGRMPGNMDMSKILNDPKLMAAFKVPEVMAALQDVMQNPGENAKPLGGGVAGF